MMTKQNKTNKKIDDNLEVIASVTPPKVKAIIYVVATILIVLVGITHAFIGALVLKDHLKILHVLFPIAQAILATIQQKFNGNNFKSVFSKNKK